jgi:putative ABC transport system permease protein
VTHRTTIFETNRCVASTSPTYSRSTASRRSISRFAPLGHPVRSSSRSGEETQRFDPKLGIPSLEPAQTLIEESVATEHVVAQLATLFGVLALLLAAIGLYGVMSYSVAKRTGEIGVRMALGASQRSVASMILREIVTLVAVGSALGVAGALALGRFVEALVFGLAPRDPLTLAAAVAVLLIVALIAGYLPARRAAGIDPIVALRTE